jgi:hypothetical protein
MPISIHGDPRYRGPTLAQNSSAGRSNADSSGCTSTQRKSIRERPARTARTNRPTGSVTRRVSLRRVVPEPDRCQDYHRGLPVSLHRGPISLKSWAADTSGVHEATVSAESTSVPAYFTRTARCGVGRKSTGLWPGLFAAIQQLRYRGSPYC